MTQAIRGLRRSVRTREGLAIGDSLDAQYQGQPGGPAVHLLSRVVEQYSDSLIKHAIRLQRDYGRNHRGFQVGVCAVALVGGRVVLLEGANYSPMRGDPRECGEMGVLAQAREAADDAALHHLYVAGPSDPEVIRTSSGLSTPTLAPCDECRSLLGDSPFTTPDMSVTTIAAGPPLVVEQTTLAGVINRYATVAVPLSSAALAAGGLATRQA